VTKYPFPFVSIHYDCTSDHNLHILIMPSLMSPYYSHRLKGQNDEKKNKFFLTKEMTRKPRKPSRSNKSENEEVLVDASPLLPKKTSIENPDSVGVLSDDKESIDADPEDQTLLSESQDVEDRQVQTQRRLDAAALQAFQDRCAITSNGEGYVDCVGGFAVVNGVTTSQTCVDACDGKCCTGASACGIETDGTVTFGFTGKGEQFGKE